MIKTPKLAYFHTIPAPSWSVFLILGQQKRIFFKLIGSIEIVVGWDRHY